MNNNYNKQYPNYKQQNKQNNIKEKNKFHDITDRLNPNDVEHIKVKDKVFEIEQTSETFLLAREMEKIANEMQENNASIDEFVETIQDFFKEVLGEEQYKEYKKLRLSFNNEMIFLQEVMSICFTGQLSDQNDTKKNYPNRQQRRYQQKHQKK